MFCLKLIPIDGIYANEYLLADGLKSNHQSQRINQCCAMICAPAEEHNAWCPSTLDLSTLLSVIEKVQDIKLEESSMFWEIICLCSWCFIVVC